MDQLLALLQSLSSVGHYFVDCYIHLSERRYSDYLFFVMESVHLQTKYLRIHMMIRICANSLIDLTFSGRLRDRIECHEYLRHMSGKGSLSLLAIPAAKVSICLTTGRIPSVCLNNLTFSSFKPTHLPICLSEKPIFFAALSRDCSNFEFTSLIFHSNDICKTCQKPWIDCR